MPPGYNTEVSHFTHTHERGTRIVEERRNSDVICSCPSMLAYHRCVRCMRYSSILERLSMRYHDFSFVQVHTEINHSQGGHQALNKVCAVIIWRGETLKQTFEVVIIEFLFTNLKKDYFLAEINDKICDILFVFIYIYSCIMWFV